MNEKSEVQLLDLKPKIIEVLVKAKLSTFKSILLLSSSELQKKTQLSQHEVTNLLFVVSSAKLGHSTFLTAFQIKHSECSNILKTIKLSTGCSVLNTFLHGGILLRHLTEISGESASGKTQFCLQLALHAQLLPEFGGINGDVAYICTEDAFPIKRLYQMTRILRRESAYSGINFMDNIHISQIGDLPSLWKCVKEMLPVLLNCKNVKLIIIDSVAALFRCEYDVNQTIERSRDLQTLAYILHTLAIKYQVAVVCINQITDVVDERMDSRHHKSIPSLGLSWSNLIHTRMFLSRTNKLIEWQTGDSSTNLTVRNLEIVFAPHLPSTSCHFIITAEGVKGLAET